MNWGAFAGVAFYLIRKGGIGVMGDLEPLATDYFSGGVKALASARNMPAVFRLLKILAQGLIDPHEGPEVEAAIRSALPK